MEFWTKHREFFSVVAGLIVVFGLIAYLGNRSVYNREALVRNAAKRSNSQYSGAIIKTNLGNIQIDFLGSKAPETVQNFIKLAEEGFYNGTKFHRVIKDFMIQGGDPNSKSGDRLSWGMGGPGYRFKDEINDEKMERGVVAMANAGPNTNGSQFFIVTASATPWLQGKHTIFAKVMSGIEVADNISMVAKDERDAPKEDVVIEEVFLR